MKFFLIGPYYINWHYTRGISELSKNMWNFIIFEFHFFSVKDLLLTLFSPFQKLHETYGRGVLQFDKILSTLIVNIVMRLVGFVVRSAILFVAFVCISSSIILFPLLLLFWIILPPLLLLLLAGSVWAYLKYKP